MSKEKAMNSSWFITGTDTEVGKTWCTLAIIQQLKNQGLRVAGMKPIATGCRVSHAGLRNSDAEQLLQLTELQVPYTWINPYPFEPPIAPHLAAQRVGQHIEIETILNRYAQLATLVDVIVVEGIGGWRVPINAQQSLREVVLALNLPVIVVVGLRLGCINHALLTVETIARDGCQLAGWIANPLQAEFEVQGCIETLQERLAIPLLAQMPYLTAFNLTSLANALKVGWHSPH
jgi:dethiobiotin synthetase